MAFRIMIKRSDSPGGVPQNLGYGELAYNFADRILYIGDRDGSAIQVAACEIPVQAQVQEQPQPDTPPRPDYTATGVRRRLLPFEG